MKCTGCGHPEAYQGLGRPECPHIECRFFSAKQRALIYPPAVPAQVTIPAVDSVSRARFLSGKWSNPAQGTPAPKSAFRAALDRDCKIVGIDPPPDHIADRTVWDAVRAKIGLDAPDEEFEYCRSSFD